MRSTRNRLFNIVDYDKNILLLFNFECHTIDWNVLLGTCSDSTRDFRGRMFSSESLLAASHALIQQNPKH